MKILGYLINKVSIDCAITVTNKKEVWHSDFSLFDAAETNGHRSIFERAVRKIVSPTLLSPLRTCDTRSTGYRDC